MKSEIEVARREVEDKVKPLEYKQLEYKRYGKKYLKEQQFSPDAVAQVAFQVSLDYHSTLNSKMQVRTGFTQYIADVIAMPENTTDIHAF